MRPVLRRRTDKGIPFFYFDLADPSHESLLKKARKLDPMAAISKVTRYDEY
ncbi:hypothetical protein [Effusibacillus consociatus]|uniref:Uncharacterized protein n=1 Tax=Effusibacillus consociatus TaxID=1117041 RepID=A0ABV9Q5C1_9BACL